ncbi:DUF2510 domain-containing protein [Streptomyces sp. SP18CS02]|uniref:DUF2510 domain-containing protein n=1 Tax=Streptomyces sp. SP18CS02 TaxID=3002531 RepID=UPI002E7890D0|nr:DUF2510 domain-containing protein [Streptomyces sp. SP18CS02]MEE1752589.1 DUF2510 domain-containing protein [Streptomyces sp. SP18CS02]
MSMTTPPGWYPDPQVPATERWWDGNNWGEHTRSAGGPPKRTGRVVALAVAGVALAAAVTAAAVLIGSGDDGAAGAGPPASPGASATASAPQSPAAAPPAAPSPSPSEDATVVVDHLNGITLPIPDGWEKPGSTADDTPTVTTVAKGGCPGAALRDCPRGTVSSRTVTGSGATTTEAMAGQDIEEAAERAFGEDAFGNQLYGGIRSHKVLDSRPVVVAGRTGHLVRWQVTTGTGPGGYVQSVVFPSSLGSQAPVVVRFAFEAGPEGPPLATMDEIMKGIRPLGSSTGGGVGSTIAP